MLAINPFNMASFFTPLTQIFSLNLKIICLEVTPLGKGRKKAIISLSVTSSTLWRRLRLAKEFKHKDGGSPAYGKQGNYDQSLASWPPVLETQWFPHNSKDRA